MGDADTGSADDADAGPATDAVADRAGESSEAGGPSNSVLDEGYDPTTATRTMGMTPEPTSFETATTDESAATDESAPTDAAAGSTNEDSTSGATAADAGTGARHASGPYGPGSAEPNEDGSGPEGFLIKGNADSMKYHTPESPSYGRTKAEVWFATEEDATAAGFVPGFRKHGENG